MQLKLYTSLVVSLIIKLSICSGITTIVTNYEKLGSQTQLICQITNNPDQFRKNGVEIGYSNTSYHNQYVAADSGNLVLLIKKLNLTDDGENVYKVNEKSDSNKTSCDYNIYLCGMYSLLF